MILEGKTIDPAGAVDHLKEDGTRKPIERSKSNAELSVPKEPIQTTRIVVHPEDGGKYWWDED